MERMPSATARSRPSPDFDTPKRSPPCSCSSTTIAGAACPFFFGPARRLWKRGTEIVVQFKSRSAEIFQGTAAAEDQSTPTGSSSTSSPIKGIEFRFHAKSPGTQLALQKVNMRFDYNDAFEAVRGTGYEILLYNALIGDMTLFSRNDLVETAWRIVQPILDVWSRSRPEFPELPGRFVGPEGGVGDMLEADGFHWIEIINRESLESMPLFAERWANRSSSARSR